MAGGKKQNTRQKMINLMYLVFIAMLALNAPLEVLDGFDLVNDNLMSGLENTNSRNKQIYTEIDSSYRRNPGKTEEAYEKARIIQLKSDSLFNYIQSLKEDIVKYSDGKKGDVNNIKSRDDLNASPEIMIVKKEGKKLKEAIETYREDIVTRIDDKGKQQIIKNSLSTTPTEKKAKKNIKDWVEASFDAMPTIAAVTYLTEIQSNIKAAEGEALSSILKSIDISDLRVNQLQAFVVPNSNVVMKGTNYTADIILAAVDTTQRPTIVVNGQTLPAKSEGKYSVGTSRSGNFTISGHIKMMSRDGADLVRSFEQKYTVIEPMATIAPLLMDVLYANYSNPISISVPGIVEENVSATAVGGSLTKKGKEWVAIPSKIGQGMTITVSAKHGNATTIVAKKEFRVRALPDPTAYIEYTDANGNVKKFTRGAIQRAALLNATGIKAAIDDGILDVPFKVLGFRTFSVDVMGNAVPEVVSGGDFSGRQIEQIRKMSRGKTMFIASIMVQGPDGTQREISVMEIRVN